LLINSFSKKTSRKSNGLQREEKQGAPGTVRRAKGKEGEPGSERRREREEARVAHSFTTV